MDSQARHDQIREQVRKESEARNWKYDILRYKLYKDQIQRANEFDERMKVFPSYNGNFGNENREFANAQMAKIRAKYPNVKNWD